MTAHADPNLTDAPALAVFGRDATGKPHASSFTATEADLAEKAAKLMGLRLLPVQTDLERALAAKLPKGRVFASGRAFVPFIKAALFTELQAAALNTGVKPLKLLTGPAPIGTGEPTPAMPLSPLKSNGTVPVKQPCGWADIQVGSIVLAAAPPRLTEWFECLVIALEREDLFIVRYCDWPKEPPFKRRRIELGLLHPAYQPEPPLEPEPPLKAA
jgi:hypothetical protein